MRKRRPKPDLNHSKFHIIEITATVAKRLLMIWQLENATSMTFIYAGKLRRNRLVGLHESFGACVGFQALNRTLRATNYS